MELLVYLYAVYGYITLEYVEDKFVYSIVYVLLLFTGVFGLIIWCGLKNRVLNPGLDCARRNKEGLPQAAKS